MKRVEFTILSQSGESLREPGFVESCSELPVALMRAMEDYLETQGGELHLPLVIRVEASPSSPSC